MQKLKTLKTFKTALENKLPAILLGLIVIQPPMDVFSYFLGLRGSNGLSTLLRTALLGAVALLGFLLSERKRIYIGFYAVVAVFWLAHMLNCWRLGYISVVQDTGSLLRLLNFPLLAMTFITILRNRPQLRKTVYLGTAAAFGEILLFTLLPWILGQPVYTYAEIFVGMIGWFATPSAQSAILVLLAPLVIFAAYRSKKYLVYPLAVFLTMAILFVTGTKLDFYSIFILAGAYIFLFILNLGLKKSIRYVAPLLVMLALTVAWRNNAPMMRRERMSNYAQSVYNSQIQDRLDEASSSGDSSRLAPERKLEGRRRVMQGVYSDDGVYGWRTRDMNERFGVYNVMDVYKYSATSGILSDARKMKQNYAKLVWEEKDLATHLLGFEYQEFILKDNTYDLENDFPGVFYNVGYLGFVLYLAFIAVFFWQVLRALAGDIQAAVREAGPGSKNRLAGLGHGIRNFLGIEMGAVGITFLLAIIAAQISGNVLRRPNVTIYFALAAACLFSLAGERTRFQIKWKKISKEK